MKFNSDEYVITSLCVFTVKEGVSELQSAAEGRRERVNVKDTTAKTREWMNASVGLEGQ